MNIQDLNSYKSPAEAAQERKDKKSFWPRMGLLAVVSFVLAIVVCGSLGFQGQAGFWATFGLILAVLTVCFVKEVR